MELIAYYVKRRNILDTVLKRKIYCFNCNSTGSILLHSFVNSNRELTGSYDFYATCPVCNGKKYTTLVESELSPAEKEELIQTYIKKMLQKEQQEKANKTSKTWNRKIVKGDPRYR